MSFIGAKLPQGQFMRNSISPSAVTAVVSLPSRPAPVKDALRQLIEGDAGPQMWPRITEPEQDSLDATCRKLNRFLRESAVGDPSD